jgi:hypothetical protein
MRAFVTASFALALALVPAAALAQATTTQQPPAGQQPPAAAAPAQPEAAAPKVPFSTPAGMLLVTIKSDKTADFEEMVAKLKAGFAKTSDEVLKKQGAGFKVYKAAEPNGPNTLYVVFVEPTVPNSEYELFNMLLRTMTPDEQRDPGAKAMWERYAAAFAVGLNKLSLTPVGGGL